MENLALISELEIGPWKDSHYLFHRRVWDHVGCVVDLGCSTWDWSRYFFGKKRVIGCDPSEKIIPEGAEFFRGFIGNFCGRINYQNGNPKKISAFRKGELEAEIITLEELIRRFDLPPISLLKMNIEGMEYDLLIHLQEPIADQMVVSFHDYPICGISNRRATNAVLNYLSEWYDWCQTSKEWGWYVLIRKG
jgi:SAM-dependent methyltransferase